MLKIAMFLGVCVAIYAIFSYLEARLTRNMYTDIAIEYLRKNEDEIVPQIVDGIIRNITDIFKEHIDGLAKLSMLNAMKELAEMGMEVYGEKKEISETGEKDNKEFTRDKRGS